MSSSKQFLLSLFATTVSIALTFGTAAIIDYNKKQREKREIVMMVMYEHRNHQYRGQRAFHGERGRVLPDASALQNDDLRLHCQ